MVAGQSPVPLVVTATTAYGSPAAAYPMNNVGVLATDPASAVLGNRMKAAFAEFLSLRHGGSGYIFGYGSGLPGQNMTVLTGNTNGPTTPAQAMVSPIPADRPFHALSYPDIDYTIMRPAALPPATYPTTPATSTDPPPNTQAVLWPPGYNPSGTGYSSDPGWRNPVGLPGIHRRQPDRGAEHRDHAAEHSGGCRPGDHCRFCCRRQFRPAGCSSPLTLSGARPRPRPLTPRTQSRRATPATRAIRT